MSTARDQASVDIALQRASWDADRSVDLVDLTVGELLSDRAHAHPDRVAIVGTENLGVQPGAVLRADHHARPAGKPEDLPTRRRSSCLRMTAPIDAAPLPR